MTLSLGLGLPQDNFFGMSPSSGPTTGLLTEAGEYLITESGDYLIQE